MDLNILNGGTQSLSCRDCCSAMLDTKKLKQRIIYTNRYCTTCSIDISRAFRSCGMKFQHILEYMEDLEMSDVVSGICSRCSTERSSYNFMDFGSDICDQCYTYLITHGDNLVGSNVAGYVARERKLRVTNPDSCPTSPQMGMKKKFRRKTTKKEKRESLLTPVASPDLSSVAEPQMEMPREKTAEDNARDTAEQEQHVSNPMGSNTISTDDALAHEVKHTNPLDIKDELTASAFDGLVPTIKNFLAKPFLISQGSFTTTDVATTFNEYFTSMAMRLNPAFSEKVRAALGLRYTTVVTMQVNGNRFQQGLYKLCFLPTGGMPLGDNGNVALNNWIRMHRGNRSQVSQLMSADLNICSDTSVQLRIPFISGFTACSFTPNMATIVVGDPGYFFIYPYQALKAATGNTAASYSLWVHYEDVEVLGNTAPNVGPAPDAGAGFTAEPQSGYRRRAQRKNEDFINNEQQQSGPISGGLKIISESAQVLTGIPLLSSYAGTLAWATNAASKAASAFGWSKPVQLNSVERRVSRYHNYLASCDQLDDSQPMGLVSTNHINVAPGFAGTDDDEMSIDYLKSIYGIFRLVPWTTAEPAGFELLKFDLSPNDMSYIGPGAVTNTINYTPVGYVGTFFEQYSGGFDIKIKIVKTEFHSGRLLFVFNPYESSIATESYTFDDTVYLTKTIIDVREANEFTMRVPFVSLTPWRPVRSMGTDTYSGKYGSIRVYVLDNLVAPDTVTNSVDLIFEVAGAPDLRFSVPSAFQTTPFVPAELQSGYELPTKINQISADFVGGNDTIDVTFKKEEYCIGETISSLRQILKRGGFISKPLGDGNAQMLDILPWAWDYNLEAEITTKTTTVDPYARLSAVFALQRGGIRLRWLAESNSGGIYAYIDRRTPNDQAVYPAIMTVDLVTTQENFIHAGVNGQNLLDKAYVGGYAMQIPFYHYNHSGISGSQGIGSNSPYRLSLRNGANLNTVHVYNSQAIEYNDTYIYRSGADDCSFGAFCSIPAMYATPSPFVPPPP